MAGGLEFPIAIPDHTLCYLGGDEGLVWEIHCGVYDISLQPQMRVGSSALHNIHQQGPITGAQLVVYNIGDELIRKSKCQKCFPTSIFWHINDWKWSALLMLSITIWMSLKSGKYRWEFIRFIHFVKFEQEEGARRMNEIMNVWITEWMNDECGFRAYFILKVEKGVTCVV